MSGIEVIIGVVGGSVALTLGARYTLAKTAYKCSKYLIKKSLKSALDNEDFEKLEKVIKKLKLFEKKYSVEKLSKYVEKYALPVAKKMGVDIEDIKDKLEDAVEGISWIREHIDAINKSQESEKFVEGFKLTIDNVFKAMEDGKITMDELESIIKMKKIGDVKEIKLEIVEEKTQSLSKTLTVIKEEEVVVESKTIDARLDRQKKREQERLRRQALRHKASRPKRPVQ